MNNVKKKLIRETVENLKCLDSSSLLLIKSGTELLKVREAMDDKPERQKGAEEEREKCGATN